MERRSDSGLLLLPPAPRADAARAAQGGAGVILLLPLTPSAVCGLLPPSAYSFHRLLTPSTVCGRSPSLEEGGLGIGKSRGGRMSAGARCAPLQRGENRNSEMYLQRWVESLQRLDAFATVGCTVGHRRGAHCAPVHPRRYNSNFSRGRAKGDRGDRKAPICNRRQGRRP